MTCFYRQWVAGTGGEIYHYDYYDPRTRRLSGLSVYEFGDGMRTLRRRTYAELATYAGAQRTDGNDAWTARARMDARADARR